MMVLEMHYNRSVLCMVSVTYISIYDIILSELLAANTCLNGECMEYSERTL